jgi:glycosyltransferase involved in cell wall biosynthesis
VRIVVISYRDMEHPQAGGAEVILYETFRRIRRRGHDITFVTGAFPGCVRTASIDGLRTLRVGRTPTFNFAAIGRYRELARSEPVDVVVEDINKIPFFTPLFVPRIPTLGIVPHLFGTTVFREAAWPVAMYVYLYEQLIPVVYRRTRFSVLSESTADDLVRRGIDRARIHVVRAGIDREAHRPPPEGRARPGPVITYLGRLKRYKSIDLVVRALPAVLRRVPNAEYWIVGEGDHREALRRTARRLGVEGSVKFLGHRGGAEKLAVLHDTRVLVYTSPKEGWGLSVIEAGAAGVPTVASDSPGLRESVQDGETGILVPHGDVNALAASLVTLLADDVLWSRLSRNARAFAERFSWEESAEATLRLVERVASERRDRAGVRE